MGASLSIPLLQDRRLAVSFKPFLGEKNIDNPLSFSGRCFWLIGQWQALYSDGTLKEAKGLFGDWPFLNLPPFLTLEPGLGAKGYEISKELILKYLFTVINAMEQYVLPLLRSGYPVNEEGLGLGHGRVLRIGLDLSKFSDYTGRKEQFDKFLKWLSERNSGVILFELRSASLDTEHTKSLLIGKTDIKGEVINEVGSILESQGELKITGRAKEWHMRKIPGWPFALQEGLPAISALITNDDEWRIIYLLHRLYGRRFQNTCFIFQDSYTMEFWRTAMHAIIKPVSAIAEKQRVKNFKINNELGFVGFTQVENVALIPDYLWTNASRFSFLKSSEANNSLAVYGWSFCFVIFHKLGLIESIWKKFFEEFQILGKIPLRFPVKNLIDEDSWVRFWQKKVGELQLEELNLNLWTFYPPSDQWKAHGYLKELLAYHSLLPFSNRLDELEKSFQNMPLSWKVQDKLMNLELPDRLAKWPMWHKRVAHFMQIQRQNLDLF